MRSGNTYPAHGFEGAEGAAVPTPVPRGLFVRAARRSSPIAPSVWNLKKFLEINDPVDYLPVPSVNVDYGFINCHTFEETCTLMEIYGEVLKTANPLELHKACIAGELFQFASRYVRMEERWRSLMRNFYPLSEMVEPELCPGPELRSEVRYGHR